MAKKIKRGAWAEPLQGPPTQREIWHEDFPPQEKVGQWGIYTFYSALLDVGEREDLVQGFNFRIKEKTGEYGQTQDYELWFEVSSEHALPSATELGNKIVPLLRAKSELEWQGFRVYLVSMEINGGHHFNSIGEASRDTYHCSMELKAVKVHKPEPEETVTKLTVSPNAYTVRAKIPSAGGMGGGGGGGGRLRCDSSLVVRNASFDCNCCCTFLKLSDLHTSWARFAKAASADWPSGREAYCPAVRITPCLLRFSVLNQTISSSSSDCCKDPLVNQPFT